MHVRHTAIVVLVAVSAQLCSSWMWPWPWGKKEGKCPDSHLIHPCTCLESRPVLTCEDLFEEDTLKSVIEASKNHGLLGVEFASSSLSYIPEDAFDGLNVAFITIENSSILALSQTDRAFVGLERTLRSLVVKNCPFANAWSLSQLANLTKLKNLEILESPLLELGPDFLSLKSLPIKYLTLLDASLHAIPRDAFSNYTDLVKVILDKNYLTEVHRSLFPRPAKNLISIGLSDNNIRSIPKDMFLDMPALDFLYLGGNNLHVLDEKTYKPVWNQLAIFAFYGNPLICDCRIRWIKKDKMNSTLFVATCANPVRLKGKHVKKLAKEDLKCAVQSNEPHVQKNKQ